MKRILAGFLVVFSLFALPVYADECEGSWPLDAAKSGDIDTLLRAKAKAGGCVIQYTSEARAVNSLREEIKKEVNNEPNNNALKRLGEVARREEVLKNNRALEFSQTQIIFDVLINIEITEKIIEQSKKPDISI